LLKSKLSIWATHLKPQPDRPQTTRLVSADTRSSRPKRRGCMC